MNDFLTIAREKIGIIPPRERCSHRMLYHEREWDVSGIGRDVSRRIVAHGMSKVVHTLLHEQESPVPVPQHHSLLHVYQNLSAGLGVYQAIDKYCILLDRANRHQDVRSIEIQLNNLSIEAVRNQLPYLRDGMGRSQR